MAGQIEIVDQTTARHIYLNSLYSVFRGFIIQVAGLIYNKSHSSSTLSFTWRQGETIVGLPHNAEVKSGVTVLKTNFPKLDVS